MERIHWVSNFHDLSAPADLIFAVDVIIYLRDLSNLIQAASRSLSIGGHLTFSTESWRSDEHNSISPNSNGWVERCSGRIAHCQEHIEQLVQECPTMAMVYIQHIDIREEESKAVRGDLFIIKRVKPDGKP